MSPEWFLECHDDLKVYQLVQMLMGIIQNLTLLCGRQETHRSTTKTRHRLLHSYEGPKAIQTPLDDPEIGLSVPDEQMLLRLPSLPVAQMWQRSWIAKVPYTILSYRWSLEACPSPTPQVYAARRRIHLSISRLHNVFEKHNALLKSYTIRLWTMSLTYLFSLIQSTFGRKESRSVGNYFNRFRLLKSGLLQWFI